MKEQERRKDHEHVKKDIVQNTHFEIGKNRLESFSDGVIAIIITLMVFNVKFPDMPSDLSSSETWKEVWNIRPQFLAYLLSFVLLGVYWVNHHHFFHALKTTDRNILWWNLNLLFWLSLIPIPTSFMAQHPMKAEATAMYGFNVLAASLSFILMGRYSRAKNLMIHNISKRRRQRLSRMNRTGTVLYIISIFAGYISVYISYVIFIIVPAMYFLPQKIELEEKTG
jgi:uncharacterized membrane protein